MVNLNNSSCKKAIVALEDGIVFFGQTCGIDQTVSGEVVFNTSPTGYQEICTDPSYAGQIVLFTTPHIGNTGVNSEDHESERVWVKGIIVLEMSKKSSSWRSEQDFISFLKENQIPWLEGIDTRKLTRHIRENGVKSGCLMVGNVDAEQAIARAKKHANEKRPDLSTVAIKEDSYDWTAENKKTLKKIAVYDFGIKTNILRKLSTADCRIKIFPNTHPLEEILSWQPDGVVISNGPGDPAQMHHAIRETEKLIASGLPIFGICLGCQLIALASGGQTKKLKFGHHGTNHPVFDLKKTKSAITSQNHHFAIDETKSSGSLYHHPSLSFRRLHSRNPVKGEACVRLSRTS